MVIRAKELTQCRIGDVIISPNQNLYIITNITIVLGDEPLIYFKEYLADTLTILEDKDEQWCGFSAFLLLCREEA